MKYGIFTKGLSPDIIGNLEQAFAALTNMCSEWASPEILNGTVLISCNDKNMLDIVKFNDGTYVDGKWIAWNRGIPFAEIEHNIKVA